MISISGVILSKIILINNKTNYENIKPDYSIIIGSLIFVIFVSTVGLLNHKLSQEIVFCGSLIIVGFLMKRLLKISPTIRATIIGTALIVFMFRAVPGIGAGMSWFEIDILGFDQSFFHYCL